MGNKQPKEVSTDLTEKQIALLKANTKYDVAEIHNWHAHFIRDCPNGRLDKKKFVQIYQELYPNGKADNFCKYAFATFDTNRDGSISFEEFLLALSATSRGDVDDRLAFAFDLYDISNDGQIDQKELTTIISAMYDLVGETDRKGDRDPKKRAADIIAKLDVTGDKKLSKAEFTTGRGNKKNIFLNRDFSSRFSVRRQQKNGTIADIFHGRQPETIALMKWILMEFFFLTANLHVGSLVVSYPYDETMYHIDNIYGEAADDSFFRDLACTYLSKHLKMSKSIKQNA